MKSLSTVCIALLFLSSDLLAETKPAVVVCDLPAVYDGCQAVARFNQTIREKEKEAQRELDVINAQGNALLADYQKAVDASKTATGAEKKAAIAEAERLLRAISNKQAEVKAFTNKIHAALQKEVADFRSEQLARILVLYREYAKTRGAISVHDSESHNVAKLPRVPKGAKKIECTKELIAYINAHDGPHP